MLVLLENQESVLVLGPFLNGSELCDIDHIDHICMPCNAYICVTPAI